MDALVIPEGDQDGVEPAGPELARDRTTWLRATRSELEDDQGDAAGEYRDERGLE